MTTMSINQKKDQDKPRASGRVRKLSVAMKNVDEDTRREFIHRKLQLLEADNYEDKETIINEEAYGESDVITFVYINHICIY